MNTRKIVDDAIEFVIKDFRKLPEKYFTEEDIRWRLMREIEERLPEDDKQFIHAEYPTPFRCSMKERSFKLLENKPKGARGHFDIVVLNKEAVKDCDFEIKRAQDYEEFSEQLLNRNLKLPFLDCVIEIKLFREHIKSKSTGPAKKRMQEYAKQSLQKVVTAFEAKGYYSEPFTKYGVVLICDASELNDGEDWEAEKKRFKEEAVYPATNSFTDSILFRWENSNK